MPNPKQGKTRQKKLTSCPKLIQPLSGGTTHTVPKPQQIWAELDSLVGTGGVQTERCPSSFFRHLCCMMWGAGQHTKQYFEHRHTRLGPCKASAPTQWCVQKSLLQCVSDTACKSRHGKLNRRKMSMPGVCLTVPILMKAPANEPSHKCF